VCVATKGTAALGFARADAVRFRGTAAREQRVGYDRNLLHQLRSTSSKNAVAAPTLSRVLLQLAVRELVSRFVCSAALAGGEAFRRSGGSGQCLHMRVMDWRVHVRADRTDCARSHWPGRHQRLHESKGLH
jgi:hypothetical protein